MITLAICLHICFPEMKTWGIFPMLSPWLKRGETHPPRPSPIDARGFKVLYEGVIYICGLWQMASEAL